MNHFRPQRRLRRGMSRVLPLGAATLLGLASWATIAEPNLLVVREVQVNPPQWRGPSLRVALVSDIHVGAPWSGLDRLQDIVEATNAAKPDLILLLGDFDINEVTGGKHVTESAWTAVLGGLSAPLGTYAVLGNHDWENNQPEIRAQLTQNGIPVLENESVRLDYHGVPFYLAGIGDSVTRHDNVPRAFQNVPANAEVLAMTHAPDVFDSIDPSVDLMVAGHTHGGQVDLPILGTLAWTEPYVYGAYARGNQRLHVTSGLGMSILPVRFGVLPEIVVLTVHPAVATWPASSLLSTDRR